MIVIICLSLIPISSTIIISNKAKANMVSDTIKKFTSDDFEIYEAKLAETLNISIPVEEPIVEEVEPLDVPSKVDVVMNFVGDCTLGADSNFGYRNTFFEVFDLNNYSYFIENMQSLFKNDDVTVANLEGTFTDYMVKTPKKFNFRASPEYANIILSGDIEIVNIANNHIRDYGQKGYDDTVNTLNQYKTGFFGYDNYYIYEKDGVKIGFAGLTSIGDGTINKRIDNAVAYFNENNCSGIVFTFHWGQERVYCQSQAQKNVAHYAIDKGADLVVGHHPHVVQGIEEYNGKYIVYSLSNFCFGGNTNPPDKDTFVFNITFSFEGGESTECKAVIYPASVSSVKNRNDYKPTLAQGEEYIRIMNKILKYSNVIVNESGEIIHQ